MSTTDNVIKPRPLVLRRDSRADDFPPDAVPTPSETSSVKSSFSQFVERNWARAPPLPGTVRESITGVTDTIMRAAETAGLPATLASLSDTMQRLAVQYNTSRVGKVLVVAPQFDDPDFAVIAKLDDEKVRAILQCCSAEEQDIVAFYHLLKHALDSVNKKRAAQEMVTQKRYLIQNFGSVVFPADMLPSDSEFDLDVLFKSLGYILANEGNKHNFVLAITHDSYYAGRETNRVLAHIGDSAAKMLLGMEALKERRSVFELDSLIQSSQCNEAWARLVDKHSLTQYIRCGANVSVNQKIKATVLEALLGAVYIDSGQHGLYRVNTKIGWLSEFTASTPKSMSIASPRRGSLAPSAGVMPDTPFPQ